MSDYVPFDLKEIADAEKDTKDRAELLASRDISDLHFVMSDERGRRVMWAILARCGTFRTPFAGSTREETDFRCGMQNIGIMLLDDLKTHCDEFYLIMERERINGRRGNTGPNNDNS